MRDTLRSIELQAREGDEVIVVADGSVDGWVRRAVENLKVASRFLVHGPTRDFGNAQRNFAQGWAHGDYLTFMDDDDIYAEEAFVKVRKAIAQEPRRALMFRMLAVWGEVIWRNERIERGNTITPMLVLPYKRGEMPEWPRRQGGDVDVMLASAPLVWRKEIIAIGRPRGEDLWF